MRIVTLASQKGGAGKSTLARQLAVIAGEGEPTWLLDRDPQATTTKWMARRAEIEGVADRPELLELGNTSLETAAGQLSDQPGTLFVDTRPAVEEREAESIRVSSFVIVPVRPSFDDLEAVGDTLASVKRIGRKAVIVVNAAKHPRRAIEARAALSRYGVPVCPTHLLDRAVYQDAALNGQGVAEMKGAAARDAEAELRAVWTWVLEAAGGE